MILVVLLAVSILPFVFTGTGGLVRYALALALVLFVPGYAMTAALFPKDGELDWIRRVALACGLSIASVALLGVLLDLTPPGVNAGSAIGSLLLLSVGVGAFAWWRRNQVPEPERLGLSIELAFPRWRELRLADRALALGVAIALTSGIGVVALGLSHLPPTDRFTEFYLLDSKGGVLDYPLSLNTTGQGEVILGVHNLEGAPTNYTVIVLLESLRTVYNATTGKNETVEGNATFVDSFPIGLASGARSEEPYRFSIPVVGGYLLEFRLYIGAPQGTPYRFVDLHVDVS